MKAAAFEYHAPAAADEAVSLLADLGDGAKVIAGGQSLVPMLAMRLAIFDHLIDVRRVDGLRGIAERDNPAERDGSVWVGAGTTQAVIGASGLVARAVPLLYRATPLIGHFQIRNRGTIGGSLAHADAAAEYPAVALALDAVVETLSPHGTRRIPAGSFFTGIWSTALEADELVTGVVFPVWHGRCGFAVEEFAARRGDFALAGAAVAVEVDPGGLPEADGATVARCAIGLFGLGQTPLRASAAEAVVTGAVVADIDAEEVGRVAMPGLASVLSDLHGSAAYRTRVGAAMVAAAWRRALGEALGFQEALGLGERGTAWLTSRSR